MLTNILISLLLLSIGVVIQQLIKANEKLNALVTDNAVTKQGQSIHEKKLDDHSE